MRHASDVPSGVLSIGRRVRVLDDSYFAPGHTGTIADRPGTMRGEPWWRMLTTERGTFRFYWIVFDQPVPDDDEPGSYDSGDVDERWIEPIEADPHP